MKTRLKTFKYWSCDLLNFKFLEKELGIVSPPHFVYDFSRKMFLMLHSVNWPNFIVSLSLFLEILGNLDIVINCFPRCDIINFEITLIFPIKPFFYLTEKSRQKFKSLKNEKSFFRLPLLQNDNCSKCGILEKLRSVLKIFKFLYFQPFHDLPNLWHRDEY